MGTVKCQTIDSDSNIRKDCEEVGALGVQQEFLEERIKYILKMV